MIARLRGIVVSKRGDSMILEAGGVGYEISMTTRGATSLPDVGEEAVVHTHLNVRDDGMSLFGFGSESERDLFRTLLGVSGVGPKLGLSILSSLTPDEVRTAVAVGDIEALTVAPGLGKRGAQRLVLELGPTMEAMSQLDGSGSSPVRRALESLGYTPAEINKATVGLDSSLSVEDQVKTALQELGQR